MPEGVNGSILFQSDQVISSVIMTSSLDWEISSLFKCGILIGAV